MVLDHCHSVPRTRGDGPVSIKPSFCQDPLFPAHAGMDRRSATQKGGKIACSPHTRGWTSRRRHGPRWSPPVPRTRGDGPWPRDATPTACLCSPHTRGWTASRSSAAADVDLFPAHAGMDRGGRRLGSMEWDCSPHTRGWTGERFTWPDVPGLFPAHAGMDRGRGGDDPQGFPVPRTRGDGPGLADLLLTWEACSPHTRGWT